MEAGIGSSHPHQLSTYKAQQAVIIHSNPEERIPDLLGNILG